MLGAADKDPVARRGDGLLVLASAHGGGLEVEACVLGGTGLGGELSGVPGALRAVGAGEVSAGVERAIIFAHRDGLDGTVEFRVPGAVGAGIEGDACRVACVDV